eukprot:6208082-Pleurochrysis_carterae.AAC.3
MGWKIVSLLMPYYRMSLQLSTQLTVYHNLCSVDNSSSDRPMTWQSDTAADSLWCDKRNTACNLCVLKQCYNNGVPLLQQLKLTHKP